MAADIEKWFCSELAKLGIGEAEDIAKYVLSIEDADDLKEYLLEFLDASDPKVRVFVEELEARRGVNQPANNVKVYRKDTSEVYHAGKSNLKSSGSSKSIQSSTSTHKPLSNGGFKEISAALTDVQNGLSTNQSSNSGNNGELGVGAKKKSKYVPLYSKEGQAKSVVQLPGRHICECQAAKHKLINNCVNCGRIVCEQEGAGPCVYCGYLVCTPEDQEIIDRGSKKGEKLRQFLMKVGSTGKKNAEESSNSSIPPSQSKQGIETALKHRDKLLDYDKNSVRRTQVIDDECDYYATDSNKWLSKGDREKLRKREEELRQSRHGSRRDRKITFDFAGRRVLDAEDDSAKNMYNQGDAVIQEVHYGKSLTASDKLINPTILMDPPKFVENSPVSWGPSRNVADMPPSDKFNPKKSAIHRIQDKELQEMSDEGMCLSMHQPWATLLVAGIKMHEGRTWYTAHRGRLWIASTAKTPSQEEIEQHKSIYRHIYNDSNIQFPKDYPTGSLLGCVSVDDCLPQDEYRIQYPDGESASPFVFICSNPQELIVKFPIKGKHKIYKLDQHIHQAAKKGLR